MAESWESQALAVVLPMASARRMCTRGARRGGVAATFARRDERAARIVVWAAPGAGGAQPIGTVTVRWGAPDAGEATLAEVSWPPTLGEADLWRAIEELAGHPILR